MASADRQLVSTYFVTYYYLHLLVSHPTKIKTYIALQNKNGISSFTIIENETLRKYFSAADGNDTSFDKLDEQTENIICKRFKQTKLSDFFCKNNKFQTVFNLKL
jgi:hypothetical protein